MEDALLLRAAATALLPVLGEVELVAPQRLPGSDRTVVLRAQVRPAAGGPPVPVVVKASLVGGARETAALRLLSRAQVPAAVRLLADGGQPPVLVLGDLGSGPTLVDRLMAPDAPAAHAAVEGWARAVGQVQAATAALGAAFAEELAALSPLGAPEVDDTVGQVAAAAASLERALPLLGLTAAPAALDELRAVAPDLAADTSLAALVPGDTCPSNAVEQDGRTVLLDFEGAQHRHVAWEAAYLTVPWPTCWCSWQLPDEVTAAALSAWRDEVAPVLPVRDAAFDTALRRATAAWAADAVGALLPRAMGEPGADDHPDPVRRAATPPRRALVQQRARLLATCGDVAPALAELGEQVAEATERLWGRQELPVAPAFR